MNRHNKFYAGLKADAYDEDDYDYDEEEYDYDEEYYEEEEEHVTQKATKGKTTAPAGKGATAANHTATAAPNNATSGSAGGGSKHAALPSILAALQKTEVRKHIEKGDAWSSPTTLLKSDMDFVLVEPLLDEVQREWERSFSDALRTQQPVVGTVPAVSVLPPLPRGVVVDALRECNYSSEDSVAYLHNHFLAVLNRLPINSNGTAAAPHASEALDNAGPEHFDPNHFDSETVRSALTSEPTSATAARTYVPTRTGKGGTLKISSSTRNTTSVVQNESSMITSAETTETRRECGNDGTEGVSNCASTAKPTTTASHSSPTKKKGGAASVVKRDDSKTDCTFVIAGHVDSGKSTTLGHLLLLLGKVSKSEVDRNERNGRSTNKQSFRYAWLLDQSEEERRRGVTIDSGSHDFETEHKRIHILDAPGHKDYVLNMISSAMQADAALLVVTAARSEFETGLEHGTKDHLIVLKTIGVSHIVVAVNKMDAVDYDQARFQYVVDEIQLLLKQTRFKPDTVVGFCPMSGIDGTNMVEVDHSKTPWYNGPSLLELVDQCPVENRLTDGDLRITLQDVQKTCIYGKVESGVVRCNDDIVFFPPDVKVHVRSIDKPSSGGPVDAAFAGDTIEINTTSSLVGLYSGCVGCTPDSPIACSTDFEAIVQTFPALEKSVLPGATFMMVAHALTIPVKVILLVSRMDKQGNWSKGMVKCIPKSTQAIVVFRAELPIPLEAAENCRALGRLLFRQDDEIVAGGLVRRVIQVSS